MPVFNSKDLIAQLERDVQQQLARLDKLKIFSAEMLKQQPGAGRWSIAQVLEHLNSYNRYYLPQIEKALQTGRIKKIPANQSFRSGWFGNYFTNIMQPGKDGLIQKKMKSPQDHAPVPDLDGEKVIREFLEGQNRLIDFLQQANHTDMGKLRVPISISKYIRLKLGDTFRFLIAHQNRHFVQIQNILNDVDTGQS